MRILKLAIVSFIILFTIVTIIGLFIPPTVKVARATTIIAPYDSVYKYINDVKYWKLWMAGADTSTISFLSAKTAGPGTVAKIGTGEVTLTRTKTDSICSVWKSAKGNVQTSAFVLFNDSAHNSTVVQWYFEQKLNWYPWERFGSLANDKFLGPVLEQSLAKLKQVLEKK